MTYFLFAAYLDEEPSGFFFTPMSAKGHSLISVLQDSSELNLRSTIYSFLQDSDGIGQSVSAEEQASRDDDAQYLNKHVPGLTAQTPLGTIVSWSPKNGNDVSIAGVPIYIETYF